MYEQLNMPKDADFINHKEYITWKEFINYFEDYREIEDRNRKSQYLKQAHENLK